MFTSLTRSSRQKSQPHTSSPVRTIIFHQEPPSSYGAKSFLRADSQQRSSRDIDDDDSEDDETEGDYEEEEGADDGDHSSQEEAISSESNSEGPEEDTPLLPLFSSAHLSTLPVFTLTHTFREMVLERCDTVLTWEQLRSPQVSQFLIKPIQQEIKDNHMSVAVLSALLANCLQFTKEANIHAGNSGTNHTRALICELIAIKVLREYTTRELIDALSYDFDPLQGQFHSERPNVNRQAKRPVHSAVKISCIEIGIRASSKRFLAHPLVVQHLEAIWNGSIVFHSAADSLHRKLFSPPTTSYGTTVQTASMPSVIPTNKKEVTLYNPRQASLFKLSRLRVPRYRNILSTISFAVLLVLFLSVLKERSLEITALEIVFWIWAAGYMLDEVIGFNEQGFSLYLASFWNTFDVGILVLLFVHLCLRIYGVVAPLDRATFVYIAHRSYDVLALSAILVFPRLFSILDHYRYFSQLIIAFRLMAFDMLAIFFLIMIFCSGFLVALTLAFGHDTVDDPQAVAYALLQMLLGFTPAAWDRWGDYNWMGRFVLILFLFVCHFVVVTILVTVLTNRVLEIARNANEEHQFLFAINAVSSVKSDALFAYIPPFNVLQWLLIPLRYVLPFREYVRFNRTIIKATHFPILFLIFAYEKLILQPQYFDTVDLVESRSRPGRIPRMMRKASVTTFRQEAALDEVFRRRANTTIRTNTSQERRKNTSVIRHWMRTVDEDVEPPHDQDRKSLGKPERWQRSVSKRFSTFKDRDRSVSRRPTSIASDPYEFASHVGLMSPRGRPIPVVKVASGANESLHEKIRSSKHGNTQTRDEHDMTSVADRSESNVDRKSQFNDYFSNAGEPPTISSKRLESTSQVARHFSQIEARPHHNRNVSSATMIYHPPTTSEREEPPVPEPETDSNHLNVPISEPQGASSKPSSDPSSQRVVKRPPKDKPRPVLPHKDHQAFRSVPDFGMLNPNPKPVERSGESPDKNRRRSLEMDLVSDIGDNKAIGGGYVGAIPASFASRMAQATNALRYSRDEQQRRNEDTEMFGRLMMARMNSLEEGFREVVHEVREGMRQAGSGLHSRQRSPDGEQQPLALPRKAKKPKERSDRSRGSVGSGTASITSDELPVKGSAAGTNIPQHTVEEVSEAKREETMGGNQGFAGLENTH